MNRRQAKKVKKKALVNIKFKLKLICILDQLDREVSIEFFVPQIFNSYKSAENEILDCFIK